MLKSFLFFFLHDLQTIFTKKAAILVWTPQDLNDSFPYCNRLRCLESVQVCEANQEILCYDASSIKVL